MNTQTILLFTITFAILQLAVQRSDRTKRGGVRTFWLLMVTLIGVYAVFTTRFLEVIVAFILGGIISGLYWILIGRYNPVKSSEDIKVLGLDD
ncbi:MAG: hypothetical protein ACOYLB_16275 [Phototrophicaceae bacterium]